MPSWSVLDGYPSFYPAFRVIYWHKIVGIIFAPTLIIASIIFIRRTKRILIHKIKQIRLRWIANILLLGGGVILAITSLGLVYTNIPDWLYQTSRLLHTICGLVIVPISIIIHIYLALVKYRPLLIQSFAPLRQSRWPLAIYLLAGLAVSWGIATGLISYYAGPNVLTAAKINETVSEVKQVDSLPWDTADKIDVKLVNGVGFDDGVTSATLRALYNDEYLFMKIQWKDNVYNRWYRPWVKNETGWIQLHPGGVDEQIYNEDKFAVLFPINKDTEFQRYGCAVYCHNVGNRGMHWTASDNPVDIWHWKSVRTDPMGYVDDKYWLGTDNMSDIHGARHGDPGEGGYFNNYVEGVPHPMMLPASVDAVIMGALVQSKAVIYTTAADDKLPVGSVVPGVLVSPISGDRGDIKSYATYEYNMWTLRIMRKLDTGSEYDVIFESGQKYDFTVAAFDHNSMRHAYNQQVYRLYLAQ